jgi:DNA-directed RNA polymerase specialized sigma24 family protein
MKTGTSVTLNAQTPGKEWAKIYVLIVNAVSKYFSISDEDQNDLTNEIFEKFFNWVLKRNEVEIENIEGYIFRTVRNEVINWQKKQQTDRDNLKEYTDHVTKGKGIDERTEVNTDNPSPDSENPTTIDNLESTEDVSEEPNDEIEIVADNEYEGNTDIRVELPNNRLSKLSLMNLLDEHEQLGIGKEFKEYIENANIYQALQLEYRETLESLPKSKDHSKYRKRGLIFMKRFCIERYPALLWHLGNLKQVLDELKQSAIKNTVPLVEHSSPQENDSLTPEEHTQEDNNSLQENDSLTPEEYTQEDNNKEKKTQSYTLNDVLEVERLMKESGKMKEKGKANIPQKVYDLICDEIFKKINFA